MAATFKPRYSVSRAASESAKRCRTSVTTSTFSGLGFSIDTSFNDRAVRSLTAKRVLAGRKHATNTREIQGGSPRPAGWAHSARETRGTGDLRRKIQLWPDKDSARV